MAGTWVCALELVGALYQVGRRNHIPLDLTAMSTKQLWEVYQALCRGRMPLTEQQASELVRNRLP